MRHPHEADEVLREALSHRATILISHDHLRTFLDLPDGLTVVAVVPTVDPPAIEIHVVGAQLSKVEPYEHSPRVDGGVGAEYISVRDPHQDGRSVIYRRFSWSPTEPHAGEIQAVMHACPVGDDWQTPCCGKTPFDLPRRDKLALDGGVVTCNG